MGFGAVQRGVAGPAGFGTRSLVLLHVVLNTYVSRGGSSGPWNPARAQQVQLGGVMAATLQAFIHCVQLMDEEHQEQYVFLCFCVLVLWHLVPGGP